MIRVILHGCKGRMGLALRQAISEQEAVFSLAAGVDALVDGSEDYPAYSRPELCREEADVLIDFSVHTAVPEVLLYCRERKLPAVIATTALDSDELRALGEAALDIPVLHSANMSVGVNLIAGLMKALIPPIEKDFNIEIIEKHHRMKKDSPSGTALLLARAINEACEKEKTFLYGRHSSSDQCSTDELGIHAVRGGTIPGEHSILMAGPDEIIEIRHTALSRSIFANGALRAAAFLRGCGPGLYTMEDVLQPPPRQYSPHTGRP